MIQMSGETALVDQGRLAAERDLSHLINQAILDGQNTEQIIGAALAQLTRMIPLHRVSVALFDQERSLMRLAQVLPHEVAGPRRGWQTGLDDVWFIEDLDRGHVTCDQQLAGTPSSAWASALLTAGVTMFVAVPLVSQETLLGTVNIGLRSGQDMNEPDHETLLRLADHLAVALNHCHLRTEIKEREQHLQELVAQRTAKLGAASPRFRVLFQQAPLGIAVVDKEGRLEMANAALAEITGYRTSDLDGLELASLVRESERDLLQMRMRELFSGNSGPIHMEMRWIRQDGTYRWAQTTISLINPLRQVPRLALVMVQDIHQERESRQALLASEKLTVMGRMAATLVHEINNPLQVVLGCLGLAEETAAEGEDVTRYLEVAHEELTRTAKIVARLRDMQQRSGPLADEPTDLATILDNVLALVEARCIEQEIAVQRHVVPSLPNIRVVPDRITQVYLNLIINALDAMPDGGRLEVSLAATTEPAGIQTIISDTGTGIDPSALEHLFEPFGSHKSRGMGLGLYISHKIVGEHNGAIEVSSQLGQGSTFTIWLPQQEEQDQ